MAPGRRLVMLVDNAVRGDSRVQKSASSAAQAGWHVVVLGRSPDHTEHRWNLGEAEVRLLPVPETLAKRRHEFRRRLLVAPFAYPPTGIAENRAQAVRAWQADLDTRLGESTVAGARRWWLNRQRNLASLLAAWVRFRSWQLRGGNGVRRRLRTPSDRLYTWFWRLVLDNRAWRRLEPGLWDYEIAYGPVIDELGPDLIHAHDFRMLGVGARAKIRSHGRARLVWDAHEYLPGVSPWRDNARWLPAHVGYEREYAPYADATITVSAELAELLQRDHGLARRPAVVLNAPTLTEAQPAPSLRALCGLDATTNVIVYSGVMAAKRGLSTMVDALPHLPKVHVAFIAPDPQARYVSELVERAKRLGAADRVHIVGYVPHNQVISLLSEADIGVIPVLHFPNHEIALITKFFEYSQARLPIVVSDVRAMAAMVSQTGQGEVFTAGDIDSYVAAVRAVLADPQRYHGSYKLSGLLDEWTWEAQAQVQIAVYQSVIGERGNSDVTVS
jgi:glycosyltransferase involved in cell wall biosynthesis